MVSPVPASTSARTPRPSTRKALTERNTGSVRLLPEIRWVICLSTPTVTSIDVSKTPSLKAVTV